MPPKKGGDYLGGTKNQWHIHDFGGKGHIKLGDVKRIKKNFGENGVTSEQNWFRCYVGLTILEQHSQQPNYQELRDAILAYQQGYDEPSDRQFAKLIKDEGLWGPDEAAEWLRNHEDWLKEVGEVGKTWGVTFAAKPQPWKQENNMYSHPPPP